MTAESHPCSGQVCEYRTLTDLPQAVRGLFDRAGQASVFLSREWFELLHRHVYSTTPDLRILAIGQGNGDGNSCLLLPLRQEIHRWGPFRFNQLSALANFYTGLYAPVCEDPASCPTTALEALADHLSKAPEYQILALGPLDPSTATTRELIESLSRRRWYCHTSRTITNWYHPVRESSFDQYWSQRPARLRNTVRRRWRKVQREAECRISVITTPPDLDAALKDYWQVYERSWKSEEGYPVCIDGFMRLCAIKGQLRLGILYLDGVPAAAQFWIIHNGSALIYKLAYDPRYKDYSVGSILSRHMFQDAIDKDRVGLIDFLTGDDAYKRDWMTRSRSLVHVQLLNQRQAIGRLYALRKKAARMLAGSQALPPPSVSAAAMHRSWPIS